MLLNGGFQIDKESCDFKNSAICLVKRLSNILESCSRNVLCLHFCPHRRFESIG